MEVSADALMETLTSGLERLNRLTADLELAVARLADSGRSIPGDVAKITASVESEPAWPRSEGEIEARLRSAEAQIAELRAARAVSHDGPGDSGLRKTLPSTTVQLLAKRGIDTLDSVEAGALDSALSGLSIEQRIAVKSQLLRTGVVTL